MGTEVLYPQNCLNVRLGSVPSTSFSPRRKPYHGNPNANSNPNHRPIRRPEAKKRGEGFSKPLANSNSKNLVMGQVTILRRREPLDASGNRALSKQKKKEEREAPSSDRAGYLIVFGTERPAMVSRQIRFPDPKEAAVDGYAGSAFSLSPSPRALPLPSFSRKKKDEMAGHVDHSATKDLRRLLRLD